MKKVELLAPAGDLDRLKLALLYGADAVYIGGKELSLRSHASNFTLADIKEGVEFAHKLNKKVYVTCNMVLHKEDKKNALMYLRALKDANVDGIITSSLDLIMLNNAEVGNEMHISTQLSTLNSEAIKVYEKCGVTRVVLARECEMNEIKKIVKDTPLEIEVFIHGGMCSSYSGKCMLSNVMTLRDANRGGCAHSCRWKYHLYDDKNKIIEPYFSMSSKDLCTIKNISKMIKCGVTSLKIEGRMKSYNYLSAVISCYRQCIDDYYNGRKMNYKKYYKIMENGEIRKTSHGFLNGPLTIDEQLLVLDEKQIGSGEFVGLVRDYDHETKTAKLEVKNKIILKNKYIKLSPYSKQEIITINKISYENNDYKQFTIANKIIDIKVNKPLKPYDIIRLYK